MSTYVYLQTNGDDRNRAEVNAYAKAHRMTDMTNLSQLSDLSALRAGDTVLLYDALSTAPSLSGILQLLQECLAKTVNVHFAKYSLVFVAQEKSKIGALIQLTRRIEADFISARNQQAIQKRQEYGIILGRPKGRKNKSLKLDKFKKEIMRYLELSISKASIAKLVDCHPQTLYDWIERNEEVNVLATAPLASSTQKRESVLA